MIAHHPAAMGRVTLCRFCAILLELQLVETLAPCLCGTLHLRRRAPTKERTMARMGSGGMGMGSGMRSMITAEEVKAKPLDTAMLKRIFGYAKPHLFSVGVLLACIVVTSLIGLIPPLLYRDLFDNVLPNRDFARLNLVALAMVGIPILSGLVNVVQRHFSAKAGEGIIHDLRQEMYNHLQRMSLRFFTNTKAGDIISRFTNDVSGAQSAITGTVPDIVTNVVVLVSTLVVMLTIEWRLTLLSMLVVPLFLIPARRIAGVLRGIRRQSMEYNAAMTNIVNETLTINGALLVKTFGSGSRESARFEDANRRTAEIGMRRAQVGQWFFFGMGISGAIGTALVYWAGGFMALNDAITAGTIVAFVAYLGRLYGPITSLSNVQVEFAQSLVSFERVFEYLDLPIEIAEKPGALVLDNVAGRIEFVDVSFSYTAEPGSEPTPTEDDTVQNAPDTAPALANTITSPEEMASILAVERAIFAGVQAMMSNLPRAEEDDLPANSQVQRLWAIEDLSFVVEPGQLVALVGPSGAGKTSVTYLLPRLYDPTKGYITLDGHDLRDVTLESLAGQIGMVTQENYLFHDTVRANLIYAKPDATQEEMEAACRAAYIHDRILAFPDGYETIVGERGYRMSGGEKQRLAIARVILKDPRILVLDEATAHLDSQSEAFIQAALEPLMEGRTNFVIAHRLSTVLAADKILVLDRGRLVEQGTHDELLAMGGLYAHLYETQFHTDVTP